MFLNMKNQPNLGLRPSALQVRLVQTAIIASRQLSEDTFVLTVKRNGMVFQPGQRVRINLKGDSVHRKYSIYSGTDEENLEFLIREVPHGYLTPQLKPLQVGDEVEIVGANGQFVLDQNLWPNLRFLFIATGTGIAPFHSMVRSLPSLDYTLLHGVRHSGEAYEADQYDRDRLVVCTSKENRHPHFNGRVTDYLRANNLEPYDHVYLCGNNDMIREVNEILLEKGYMASQIHNEVYF